MPLPPDDRCPLCRAERACVFHAAATTAERAAVATHVLQQRGADGLVMALMASFAELEGVVSPMLAPMLGARARRTLTARLQSILDRDGFDPDGLRELAAVALATAILCDEDSDDGARQDRTPDARRVGG